MAGWIVCVRMVSNHDLPLLEEFPVFRGGAGEMSIGKGFGVKKPGAHIGVIDVVGNELTTPKPCGPQPGQDEHEEGRGDDLLDGRQIHGVPSGQVAWVSNQGSSRKSGVSPAFSLRPSWIFINEGTTLYKQARSIPWCHQTPEESTILRCDREPPPIRQAGLLLLEQRGIICEWYEIGFGAECLATERFRGE